MLLRQVGDDRVAAVITLKTDREPVHIFAGVSVHERTDGIQDRVRMPDIGHIIHTLFPQAVDDVAVDSLYSLG